jgi:hypothetical protein
MNTSSVFVSMEEISKEALLKKVIEQVGGAQVQIPSNFNLTTNNTEKVFVRVSVL